jgi:hypothetical protein
LYFEKSKSGKRHCFFDDNRENEAGNFSQIWRALKKNKIYFEK